MHKEEMWGGGRGHCYINLMSNDHPLQDQEALLTTRESGKGRVTKFFFVGISDREGRSVN